ncbi:MAG: tRNA (adenosine(37)-N6)-threonylcarbamoyltransferase complex transferase subunit TsaD [Deltaproteobacteria bacterium]|nr:tRNA (adenosine(37)-N6)-threonylcarbamoyltransferase complex transferase subunit TsaD [Deltaproteobacteria bacterium]
MLVLAIETSCDETSVALVRDGSRILSNVVSSQVDIHERFGGVVPELASRKHLENIGIVIDEALHKAQLSLNDVEGICVTRGPGLIGALLVGLSTAKALAFALRVPWVGLHHMEGHILAVKLERELEFPFLALAVSGAHTHLYRVDGYGCYQTLGRTLDDAAGEAYDKVGKLLGLGYPAGAAIDRLAAEGDSGRWTFPRALLQKDNLDFSFSGLKTAVWSQVSKVSPDAEEVRHIAAGFQEAVVDVLTRKTLKAVAGSGLRRVVVAGGVACNRGLRERFNMLAERHDFDVYFPSPGLCADNAAMLAVAGNFYLENGCSESLSLNAVAQWILDSVKFSFD